MSKGFFRKFLSYKQLLLLLFVVVFGCEASQHVIVTGVDEREANTILVFLASRGIDAQKMTMVSSAVGGEAGASQYNISVSMQSATEAMSLLNQNGLPRKKGPSLLELFKKEGLMSSEKEETIRYQAGLAEQIAGTIRKIDGIIDADVQLSFPPPETGVPGMGPAKKPTASIYVKHQGILDDPNSHLVTKIKLLVAGSVNGMDVNDVTVISDRARLADIQLGDKGDKSGKEKEMVSIWSMTMDKESAAKFQSLFLCFYPSLSFFW